MARADPDHADHDHTVEAAYGRPGDPAKGGRVVQVILTETDSEMAFMPTRVEAGTFEYACLIPRHREAGMVVVK
jgi:uncharacterized cupredoxin-like copper-binding protein